MSKAADFTPPCDTEGEGGRRAARTPPSPRDTANYIADMVLEMRNMAKAAGLTTLLGLLEVTFYEAFSVANRVEIPEAERQRLIDLARMAEENARR